MNEIDHTYWYLSRAAGIVAYLLLFASVTLGLTMTGGALERLLRRYRVYDLHRFVSLLSLGAIAFHMLVVLPDRYIRFGLADVLVPFASSYRRTYMAFGVSGFYLVAAVIAAFYMRPFISYRAWRLLHYATFGAFLLAFVHGVGAGTDSPAGWLQYTYAATGLVAFNLLVYRLLKGSARAGANAPGISDRQPARSRRALEPPAVGMASQETGEANLLS